MTAEPTKGAAEGREQHWHASPAAAIAIRALVVVVPFVVAWFTVTAFASLFFRPSGVFGVVLWLAQAMVTGLAVSMTAERFTRKALPLAVLLNMTLVFPDQAPSRFSVALRTNTVKRLRSRSEETGLRGAAPTTSESEAAAAAVELVGLLSKHDRLTRGHTERVRAYTDLIAEEIGLSPADRAKLAWGALLHDLGKLMVPGEILNKPGRPTDAEWAILKTHPTAAADRLRPLENWLGPWIAAAAEHHERWDGTGYPAGLAATDISLAGRIVAVADAYDVITSRRSYKSPLSPEAARAELERCAGTQFDPNVVRAFLNISLGRRWVTGPLASIFELPGVLNVGANLPAASAIVAGAVATAGSLALPMLAEPDELAFAPPAVVAEAAETESAAPVSTDGGNEESSKRSAVETEWIGEAPAQSSTTETTPTTEEAGPSTETTTTTIAATTQQPTTLAPTTTTTASTTTQPSTTTTVATTTTTQSTTTTTAVGPTAVDDAATTEADSTLRINVLDNDDPGSSPFDHSTFEVVVFPEHAIDLKVQEDHIRYRSEDDFQGIDQLQYRICNTAGLCDTATVTITVVD